MRKRILIAAAIIVVGAGAAGATVAFKSGDIPEWLQGCGGVTGTPGGGWTGYCPMPEHSIIGGVGDK
ncbi:hypothetical protein [Actinopolymorpha pittospori]|uniref:Uncharacterized protein n=1 Tax=Actinopolymorpha pittospori TaxID=648752 RepID=A0A927RHI7_9ACTN|nr:hypothetical protein [Actinopolymorpha pittospori]MBE1612255.1 hypothetical protein [Actinopolymorpha pittospori]